MTRAYISGSPEVAHARVALESSTRRWVDLALGDSEVGDRDAIVRILEDVLFANMVGLVTGGRAPGRSPTSSSSRPEPCCGNDDGRRATPAQFTTKIRDFAGETPLQAMAKQGDYEPTAMTSRERFPYYTAFPFSWYRACDTADLAPGSVRPIRLLARDLVLWRDEQRRAARHGRVLPAPRRQPRARRPSRGLQPRVPVSTGGSTTATGATCASRTAIARTPRRESAPTRPSTSTAS